MTQTKSLPAGKNPLVTPYRVAVSLLLAAAAAALYIGVVSSVDHKTEITNSQNVLDVRPAANDTALRQARIFAKLKAGYTGILIVDGVEIPEDQLDRLEGIDTVGFTPGSGTEIGALKPGRRCATVVYWSVEASRSSAESYEWCWQVH
ncbi:MAG: hypothetical protein QOI61_1440 [Actinomycetota bacterium]|jgi:hypothetical protein